MKTDRKKLQLQLFLNSALLLGLVLSGIVSYSLSSYPASVPHGQILYKVSLINIILILIVIVLFNLLSQKFHKQAACERQHIDPLTGFITRHAFREVFEHALLAAKRSLEPLSVILIDVDHFRTINEKHGYQVGDIVLSMLSKSVHSVLRAADITCRWEGDQILVVLKDCSIKDSCRIADKMLQKVRGEHLQLDTNRIRISTSIGTAQMLSNDTTESLAARAETGLHSARDNGRNTYAIGYDWILIDYTGVPIF